MSDTTGAESATPATAAEKPEFVFKRHAPDWLAVRKRILAHRGENKPDWDDIYISEGASGTLEDLDHFAHPTFVMAPKKSVLGQEILASLFNCKNGHSNLVICHAPGVGTAITGVLHNSVTIKSGKQVPIVFGDDQKAAAEFITLAIHYGILPQELSVQKTLVIGIQAYRDAKATKPENAYDNAVDGYLNAAASALTGGTSQETALACCGKETHPFSKVVPHPYPAIPTA